MKKKSFRIKASNGEEVLIGIRKEYDVVPFKYKPLGIKWTVIWRAYGYKSSGYHKEEWLDFLEDKKPEDVISDIRKKYGPGEIWGIYEEIITRA